MAFEGSPSRFYTYMSLMKDKTNNYLNEDVLKILNQFQEPYCEIFTEEEQYIYSKIIRILVSYFFKSEFTTINLTTKKMRSDKKRDHLQVRRTLH